MNSPKRSLFLSAIGIALISLLTCGFALPFLLWARGPKTREYRNKLVGWSVAGLLMMGIIGSFAPDESSSDSTTTTEKKATTTSEPIVATTSFRPVSNLDDLSVSSSKYLYEDCNQIDWCWQPRGTYTNTTTDRTITYLEIVYVIQARGAEIKHVDRMLKTLKPGERTPIMSGEYSYSFRLEFYNEQAKIIGSLLGSTYVTFWAEVRYLRYSDGTSVGTRVG